MRVKRDKIFKSRHLQGFNNFQLPRFLMACLYDICPGNVAETMFHDERNLSEFMWEPYS